MHENFQKIIFHYTRNFRTVQICMKNFTEQPVPSYTVTGRSIQLNLRTMQIDLKPAPIYSLINKCLHQDIENMHGQTLLVEALIH